MRIYIAGPYGRRDERHTIESLTQNVGIAVGVARELVGMGHTPFVPHLYHWVHMASSEELPEDRWLGICLEWIPCCEGLFRIEGESIGADAEVALADDLGIPVYFYIEEVPCV